MDKAFHQIAPVLALASMPEDFRAFLISDGYTVEQLAIDADLPDLVDKDNVLCDAEIHHGHSYKMIEQDGQLVYADGDCIFSLQRMAADFHDFIAEKNFPMARYSLAKMCHYVIDGRTYPHHHRGKPWSLYHVKFEEELAAFIEKHQGEIGQLMFKTVPHIESYSVDAAHALWQAGLDTVEKYLRGEPLGHDQQIEICRICVQGIGDVWTTLWNEAKGKVNLK